MSDDEATGVIASIALVGIAMLIGCGIGSAWTKRGLLKVPVPACDERVARAVRHERYGSACQTKRCDDIDENSLISNDLYSHIYDFQKGSER